MANGVRTITVRLTHPDQLFVASGVSPSSSDYNEYTAQPAMDTVRDELLAHMPTSHTSVVLRVVLPDVLVTDGLADDLTTAVRRWLRVQNVVDVDVTTADTSVARRLFLSGAGAFFVLQVTAIWVRKLGDYWDNFFVDAVGEGLSVASWVMLWFPVQNATVEGWRAGIRRKRMTVMERMVVTVVPESLSFP